MAMSDWRERAQAEQSRLARMNPAKHPYEQARQNLEQQLRGVFQELRVVEQLEELNRDIWTNAGRISPLRVEVIGPENGKISASLIGEYNTYHIDTTTVVDIKTDPGGGINNRTSTEKFKGYKNSEMKYGSVHHNLDVKIEYLDKQPHVALVVSGAPLSDVLRNKRNITSYTQEGRGVTVLRQQEFDTQELAEVLDAQLLSWAATAPYLHELRAGSEEERKKLEPQARRFIPT